MRFRYLQDPLFLFCVGFYFVNRWVIKEYVTGGFWHEHLNDLICAPLFTPILVLCLRVFGLRPSDIPPATQEVLIPVVVWSLMFEVRLPRDEYWGRGMVPDPKDVVYYALGGLIGMIVWKLYYRDRVLIS